MDAYSTSSDCNLGKIMMISVFKVVKSIVMTIMILVNIILMTSTTMIMKMTSKTIKSFLSNNINVSSHKASEDS